MQRVLITGGSTRIHIDKVRVITNIFKGKTGNAIAEYLVKTGKYNVDLITSNKSININDINLFNYKTYDELYDTMKKCILENKYDIIIHSAAVSDYKVIDVNGCTMTGIGKISSVHDELIIKMKPTRKIVDDIRNLWGYKNKLIKFKLQVDMSDKELIEIAINSMEHSNADMIVANCLEWCNERAYIINKDDDRIRSTPRTDLPKVLEEYL